MVEPGEDVFVPDGRVDTINTNNNSNIANKQNARVDVDELLDFIFPKSMQHPLSTGRLYAFAAYGPLGENANIRAGHGGMRIVSPWEMDTMCLQFEREDILQVGSDVERAEHRIKLGSIRTHVPSRRTVLGTIVIRRSTVQMVETK